VISGGGGSLVAAGTTSYPDPALKLCAGGGGIDAGILIVGGSVADGVMETGERVDMVCIPDPSIGNGGGDGAVGK
jgi:hypothetical protein